MDILEPPWACRVPIRTRPARPVRAARRSAVHRLSESLCLWPVGSGTQRMQRREPGLPANLRLLFWYAGSSDEVRWLFLVHRTGQPGWVFQAIPPSRRAHPSFFRVNHPGCSSWGRRESRLIFAGFATLGSRNPRVLRYISGRADVWGNGRTTCAPYTEQRTVPPQSDLDGVEWITTCHVIGCGESSG